MTACQMCRLLNVVIGWMEVAQRTCNGFRWGSLQIYSAVIRDINEVCCCFVMFIRVLAMGVRKVRDRTLP